MCHSLLILRMAPVFSYTLDNVSASSRPTGQVHLPQNYVTSLNHFVSFRYLGPTCFKRFQADLIEATLDGFFLISVASLKYVLVNKQFPSELVKLEVSGLVGCYAVQRVLPATQRNIREEQKPQHQRCGNLKSLIKDQLSFWERPKTNSAQWSQLYGMVWEMTCGVRFSVCVTL